MKIITNDPPRTYTVSNIRMSDCAHIIPEPDDLVTFYTDSEAEYDVARKDWGFYATPSLNGRLKNFGLRGVLVKGPTGKFFVWLVEQGKEDAFMRYLENEQHRIITWLDNDAALERLEKKLGDK